MLSTVMNMNWALIMGVLFGISESLALIPGIQSNSIFQLVYNGIKNIKKYFTINSQY